MAPAGGLVYRRDFSSQHSRQRADTGWDMGADLHALRRTARAALAARDGDRLQTACDAILKASPDDAGARRLLGRRALQTFELNKAEGYLREAAARDPANPAAWAELARALVERRADTDAEAMLAAADARGVRSPGSLTFLAALRIALGRPEEARATLEAALDLDPGHGDALRWLAEMGALAPGSARHAGILRRLSAGALSPAQSAAATYALAEAALTAGDEDGFARHLHDANALQHKSAPADDAWLVRLKNAAKAAKTMVVDTADTPWKAGVATDPPVIFILAPPGVGGGLAERLVGAAGAVRRGGLAGVLAGPMAEAVDRTRKRSALRARKLSRDEKARLVEIYLARTSAIPGAPATPFIDAHPGNVALAPLAAALFTNAKFLRVRRPLADAGLAIWRRPARKPAAHKTDLVGVTQGLMRAEAALDAFCKRRSDVVEADYNRLVKAPVTEARRLAKALGLTPPGDDHTPQLAAGLTAWEAERTETRITPGEAERFAGALAPLFDLPKR